MSRGYEFWHPPKNSALIIYNPVKSRGRGEKSVVFSFSRGFRDKNIG